MVLTLPRFLCYTSYKLKHLEVRDRMKRRTNAGFIQEVHELVGDDYEVLSEYKGVRNKVLFRNSTNGNEFWMTPHHFINRGQRDHKGERISETTYEKRKRNFLNKLEAVSNGRYKLLGEYKTAKTPTLFLDTKTNEEFMHTPDKVLQGYGNPKYRPNKKKNTKAFSKEVEDLTNGEYKVVGTYIDAVTNIDLLHVTNGNIFSMTPHNFLRGQRDPKETLPKGEKEVMEVLDYYNVDYIHQYHIPTNKGLNSALRPDFFLPKYNAFIEFDGIQHTVAIDVFGGEEALASQQLRDRKKNAYAYEHGIKMIRIPYVYLGSIKEFLAPFIEEKATEE